MHDGVWLLALRVSDACDHARNGHTGALLNRAGDLCAQAQDHDSLGILSRVDGVWLYVAIFFLLLIQECGVPFPILPSEVVLLGSGFLAAGNLFSLVIMGVLGTSATLLGNSLLFLIGRRYGRAALDRYGKYVHMHTERVDRIERWIERRGSPILFYGPLMPVLRAYMPALAGIFGVPYRAYIGILAGAALIWTFTMLILGYTLGAHWFDAVHFIRHNITIGVVVLVVVVAVVVLILRWTRGIALTEAGDDEEMPDEPAHAGTTKRLTLHG
ncbi:MAG: DedA family protein, partial [Chloroflexota bacterium]